MTSPNPLDALTVDVRELDRALVADLLRSYLQIDRDTATVLPLQPAWDSVSVEARVCLYLLARRAMVALEIPGALDGALPVEVVDATGIPGGSVRPALMRLLRRGFVERYQTGAYYIPNHLLNRVRRALSFAGPEGEPGRAGAGGERESA